MSEFLDLKLHNGIRAYVRKNAVTAVLDDQLPDGSMVTRILLSGSNVSLVADMTLNKLIDQLDPPAKKAKKAGG